MDGFDRNTQARSGCDGPPIIGMAESASHNRGEGELDFLRHVQTSTATMLHQCPDFKVFSVAETGLVAALRKSSFGSYSGENWEIMNRICEHLKPARDNDALWGLIYRDLNFCSGMDTDSWSPLVRSDPKLIRLAIEMGIFVFGASGMACSSLATLIQLCGCQAEAERQAVEICRLKSTQEWWPQYITAIASQSRSA